MKDHSKVYWELGRLQVPYETIADLMGKAIISHKGWEPGYMDIPGTDQRLKYNPGTDGWDAWFEVEAT